MIGYFRTCLILSLHFNTIPVSVGPDTLFVSNLLSIWKRASFSKQQNYCLHVYSIAGFFVYYGYQFSIFIVHKLMKCGLHEKITRTGFSMESSKQFLLIFQVMHIMDNKCKQKHVV